MAEWLDDGAVVAALALIPPPTDVRTIHTRVDESFLRWRFATPLLGYRVVERDDTSIIVRARRRGDALELVLVAAFGEPGAADRLAASAAREAGADYVIRLGPARPRTRFVSLPGGGPILTWRTVDDHGAPPLSNWSLTLGNVELFGPRVGGSRRRHDRYRGEVGPETPRVAGEQVEACDCSVSADEEVRERGESRPSAAPVPDERLPSEEGCLPRNSETAELVDRQGFLEPFDRREPDRHLGIDDRVHVHRTGFDRSLECTDRPVEPFKIFGENVEDHIGVDEGAGHRSVSARERHDLVGRHLHVAPTPEALDDTAATGDATRHLPDDDGVAVSPEGHLAPWSDPELVSELLRDRDLPLLGDPHE